MNRTPKNLEHKVEINNVQKAKRIKKNGVVTLETQLSISQLLPGRSQDSKLRSVSCWLKQWRYSEVLATKHLLLKSPAKERKTKEFTGGRGGGKKALKNSAKQCFSSEMHMLHFTTVTSLFEVFYREEERMEQLS